MPVLIATPFATNGTKNDIPETTGAQPQNATMDEGFPAITQQPISTGGIPPERADFNGILYALSDNISHINKGLAYSFDTAFATKIGGYPLHAELVMADGTRVVSTIANNMNDPNVDMTGWRKGVPASDVTDESGLSQQQWNNGVESIADLLAIPNPKNGSRVFVKSYHAGLAKGSGDFIYDSTKSTINDGVVVFNGWVRQIINNVITVEMGGAKGDGVTDDSAIIQNLVKAIYPDTITKETTGAGIELQFSPVKVYKILNEILLPPYCRLNGNGALLIGNDKANDCFVSAKWVDGVLTKTAGTAIGLGTYYTWSSIERFKFQKFNRNVYLFGWVLQCYLFKLESLNSNQHIVSSEHYFLTLEQCSSDWTGTGTGLPNYYFGVYSGMLTLRNLSASSCDVGYFFALGLQAVTLSKIDAESVGTAIKMNGSGQTGGILVTGGYFENCGTVIDATEVGSANATIDMTNCFVNGLDTIVCDTTGGNVAFIAEKEKNYVQNHKTWLKELSGTSFSKTSQGMIYVTNDTIAPNSPNGVSHDTNLYYEDNPVAWCKDTHKQTVTSYRGASGKTQAIHEHYFSVIPARYYGNQGAPEPNIVPFCSHTMTTPSGGVFSCVITTGIVSNNFVQGVFNLELVTDNSAVGMLSGRFYQTKAVIDVNDKTLTVSVATVNNVIVLTIGGLTGSSYLCRGFVKLI